MAPLRTVRARCQVVVDVELPDCWHVGTFVDEIERQAIEQATHIVEQMLSAHPNLSDLMRKNVRFVRVSGVDIFLRTDR